PSNEIRNEIKDFAIKHQLPFFNPREQSGLLRTLMIRIASTGEIMVVLQFFKEDQAKRELLLSHVKKTFPQITALQYVINPKQNDTIYDLPVQTYHGKDFITEKMEGLSFKIHAKSFYQTNSKQAFALYSKTRALAAIQPDEIVYDLYTGIGSIALFVARNAKKVIGIESVPEAIENAKENAQINNIDNVAFYCGDMRKIFNETFTNTHEAPDVVITDPPRDGMHKDVVEHLLKLSPSRIVYVSCNSATQARDLALLKEKYNIIEVQPVDMFPQTHHVENIVLLQKHVQ
ncbi:MAG: 23S rRNA (uracil(1939)-C(5))-methyltransferase RlmD, partial [Flavobacteriaceae bacterium]|nr:23S rRNA (uracil(1939)-C(5))-methyltransferase RlmD [Flavobacteriaceae bacterium]